jgi:hypothetical protein
MPPEKASRYYVPQGAMSTQRLASPAIKTLLNNQLSLQEAV